MNNVVWMLIQMHHKNYPMRLLNMVVKKVKKKSSWILVHESRRLPIIFVWNNWRQLWSEDNMHKMWLETAKKYFSSLHNFFLMTWIVARHSFSHRHPTYWTVPVRGWGNEDGGENILAVCYRATERCLLECGRHIALNIDSDGGCGRAWRQTRITCNHIQLERSNNRITA